MLSSTFQNVCLTCAHKSVCSYKRIFTNLADDIDDIEASQDGLSGINFTVDVTTGCDCYITLK